MGRQERGFSTSKTPTERRQVSNGGLWSLMTGCRRPESRCYLPKPTSPRVLHPPGRRRVQHPPGQRKAHGVGIQEIFQPPRPPQNAARLVMGACGNRQTLLPALPAKKVIHTTPQKDRMPKAGGFNTRQAGGRPTGWAIKRFSTSKTPTERRQVSNGGLWRLIPRHNFTQG